MNKRLMFVSPHLDDAILSCGARIVDLIQKEHQVVVATIFSSPGNLPDEATQSLYLQRKSDDRKAVQSLGTTAVHLNFTDAPFRNPFYGKFSSILFHHQLPERENRTLIEVSDQLLQLLDDFKADEVVWPLGVGGHIDHHLIFACSRLLREKVSTEFSYYEDLPYSLIPGWNAVRWSKLNAIPEHKCERKFNKMSLIDTPFDFVYNYHHSGDDLMVSSYYYENEWDSIQPEMCHAKSWTLDQWRYDRQAYKAPSSSFKMKCDAIACYTTEWPTLFGQHRAGIDKTLFNTISENYYQEFYWSEKCFSLQKRKNFNV